MWELLISPIARPVFRSGNIDVRQMVFYEDSVSEPTRPALLAYCAAGHSAGGAEPAILRDWCRNSNARDIGLPIATVGYVLLLGASARRDHDPVAGWAADRFRPRFGRRRLWVALSAPLVGLSAWFVLAPRSSRPAIFYSGRGAVAGMDGGAGPLRGLGAELSRAMPAARGSPPSAKPDRHRHALGLARAGDHPAAGSSSQRADCWRWLADRARPARLRRHRTLANAGARRRSRVALDWRRGLAALTGNRPFRRFAPPLHQQLRQWLAATLFLFFVADRLGQREAAGPLLVL